MTKVALRLGKAFKAKGYRVDLSLIETGAMLHDIGRGVTHGVEHGAIGGQIVRRLGFPMEVAFIVERHVGAGLTEDEARRSGLPPGRYVPESWEEKVVCYADKLIEGDHEVPIDSTIEALVEELGADHPGVARMRALRDEVEGIVGKSF